MDHAHPINMPAPPRRVSSGPMGQRRFARKALAYEVRGHATLRDLRPARRASCSHVWFDRSCCSRMSDCRVGSLPREGWSGRLEVHRSSVKRLGGMSYVVTFLEPSPSCPCMPLEALNPAGAPANLSGERISPAGQAGLLAAAATSAAPNSSACQVLRCAPATRMLAVSAAPFAVSQREPLQGRPCEIFKGDHIMAVTLGTFTKLDDGLFTGTSRPSTSLRR
jgi:hypothetical protein